MPGTGVVARSSGLGTWLAASRRLPARGTILAPNWYRFRMYRREVREEQRWEY